MSDSIFNVETFCRMSDYELAIVEKNIKIAKQKRVQNRAKDVQPAFNTMGKKYIEYSQSQFSDLENGLNVPGFPNIQNRDRFYNPYSYGAEQYYTEPYGQRDFPNPTILRCAGMSSDHGKEQYNDYNHRFPAEIRNVDVESTLIQREPTHYPGQRKLTETEINRFWLLPYDPQDTKHIIMPNGEQLIGRPTRTDRLQEF